jgi:RNA polymerase sigma-70 factor, ECF subfamily
MTERWEGASDDQLVAECSRRPANQEAWLEFWRRFQPLVQRRVLSVLLRFTKQIQRQDLDDIIQFIFLKIWKNLDRFDPKKSPLRAYLSLLSANVVIDALRQSESGHTVSLDMAVHDALVYSSGLDLLAEWDAIVKCLKELGEPKASIVEEYLEGADVAAICQKYKVTQSNVYTIVSRFRKELRSQLWVR